MPSLYKRSNGIYYYSFKEGDKYKARSTGERTKAAALKALISLEQSKNTSKPKVTLEAFIKDFLAYAEAIYSKKTVIISLGALRRFLSLIADKPLLSITAKDVDLYRTERQKEVSPISVNIELRALRAAFYTALRWDLLEENPFKKVPLFRVPDQQPLYLSREDFQKLISFVQEEWLRDLVIAAVSTGLRKGELLNLTWKDVDFERRLLRVHSSENFRTKGGKRRDMPMNQVLVRLLWKKAQRPTSEYVFTVRGRKVLGSSLSHKFKTYVRKARLDPKLHFHSLRHTFATWLVQEGVSIYEVQKLLGHSSIAVTQIYSHLASSELHGAVNRIQIALN